MSEPMLCHVRKCGPCDGTGQRLCGDNCDAPHTCSECRGAGLIRYYPPKEPERDPWWTWPVMLVLFLGLVDVGIDGTRIVLSFASSAIHYIADNTKPEAKK